MSDFHIKPMTIQFCKLTHKKYKEDIVWGIYLGEDYYVTGYSVVENGKSYSSLYLSEYWDLEIIQTNKCDFDMYEVNALPYD